MENMWKNSWKHLKKTQQKKIIKKKFCQKNSEEIRKKKISWTICQKSVKQNRKKISKKVRQRN